MEPRAGFASKTPTRVVAFPVTLRRNVRPAVPSNIGDILSYGFWLEKRGYKPQTVRSAVSSLKAISRRVNLLDVQQVLAYLAKAQVSDVRKEGLASYLYKFYSYKGIPFDKPRYKRVEKLPFIPQESEIDQLIGGVGKKSAA